MLSCEMNRVVHWVGFVLSSVDFFGTSFVNVLIVSTFDGASSDNSGISTEIDRIVRDLAHGIVKRSSSKWTILTFAQFIWFVRQYEWCLWFFDLLSCSSFLSMDNPVSILDASYPIKRWRERDYLVMFSNDLFIPTNTLLHRYQIWLDNHNNTKWQQYSILQIRTTLFFSSLDLRQFTETIRFWLPAHVYFISYQGRRQGAALTYESATIGCSFRSNQYQI